MYRISTFWSCAHLQKTEDTELPSSRRKLSKSYPVPMPLRPAAKFLEEPCRACREILITPELSSQREKALELIKRDIEWEAYTITVKHTRKRHNTHHKVKRAERKAAEVARTALRVEHDFCEGCGSRLKKHARYDLPVCAAGCDKLWKAKPGKKAREREEVEVPAERKHEEEQVEREQTWDQVAEKHLGKSRRSQVSIGSLHAPILLSD